MRFLLYCARRASCNSRYKLYMSTHGLLKNTAGYVTFKRKNYQADAVKHFSKIDDAFTY